MATVVQKLRRRTRKLTEAEFMRLPDDGRKYELVDGQAKEVPTSVKHDVIGMRLAFSLMPHLSDKAYFTGAQAGYRMASGNIRVPDVGIIFKQSLPEGKLPDGFGDRAPDLAIEIVSPNEDMPDLMRKVGEYFESGAQPVLVRTRPILEGNPTFSTWQSALEQVVGELRQQRRNTNRAVKVHKLLRMQNPPTPALSPLVKGGFVRIAKLAYHIAQQTLPTYAHPKSRHDYTFPQRVACVMLKIYLNYTYRDLEEWLLATDQVRQVLQLTRVPDHTTLYRTFAKLSQAQWQQLNDALLQHLQVNEMTVAVDTTGFRNDTASAYYQSRRGGRRRSWH